MDKLDYDLHHVSGVYSGGDEGIVFIPPKASTEKQNEAIQTSAKIIQFLENEIKAYNTKHSKRVKLPQAKKAYCMGARMRDEVSIETPNAWGLARVNLFLRIIAGEIGEIYLDISKKTSYNKLVDITDQLTPTEEDFKKAEADIKKHSLDFQFDNIDELYLEEEPLDRSYYWVE